MEPKKKKEMRAIFEKLCPDAFRYHHYDLAAITPIKNPAVWKEFLTEQDIRMWIDAELAIINTAELQKLIKDINKNNSIGTAQIINALQKLTEKDSNKNKEGPVFVFSYIPLNEQQKQANNVQILDADPFLKTTN